MHFICRYNKKLFVRSYFIFFFLVRMIMFSCKTYIFFIDALIIVYIISILFHYANLKETINYYFSMSLYAFDYYKLSLLGSENSSSNKNLKLIQQLSHNVSLLTSFLNLDYNIFFF